MEDSFVQGANMYLQMRGLKRQEERDIWLQRLQQQQLETQQQQFGLQQQQAQSQMSTADLQRQHLQMQMEQERRSQTQMEGYRKGVKDIFAPKFRETPVEPYDIPVGQEQIQVSPMEQARQVMQLGAEYGQPKEAFTYAKEMWGETKPKEWEPKPYINAQGNTMWITPGQPIPPGAKPYEKPVKEAATPTEIQEYLLSVQQGFKGSFMEWKEKTKKPLVDVTVKTGQEGFEEISKKMGIDLVEQRKNVVQSVGNLQELQQAKKLLSSGVITGFGADYILSTGKALQQIGINFADDPIANTEAYASMMGRQVGQIIKAFGAGTGLSDADREYAEKIAGGKITLNKQSMEKIIGLNERGLKNVIKNYNKTATEVMKRPEAKGLPYNLMVDVPPGLIEEDKIRFSEGSKIYNIPSNMINEFIKDHPNARQVK